MKTLKRCYLACLFMGVLISVKTFSQNATVNYVIIDSLFANPERGFYHHTETHSNSYVALNSNILKGYRTNENITLILRIFYMENFKTTPIGINYLNLIQQDLNAVRTAGIKCIVRFAYADAQGPADAPKNIILQQLDQLQPILQTNADIIAVMQAGFIGSWGEWYYTTQSEFGVPPAAPNYINRGQVLTKILSVLPASRMVQLRTLAQKQSGRSVIQKNISVTNEILNEKITISELEKGIYFLNIRSDHESYVVKFVKK